MSASTLRANSPGEVKAGVWALLPSGALEKEGRAVNRSMEAASTVNATAPQECPQSCVGLLGLFTNPGSVTKPVNGVDGLWKMSRRSESGPVLLQ